MAGPLRITLYFDCISPYTYLAWVLLQRYKKLWNLELTLKPIFLGGVMNATGNQPPAMLPPRAVFQVADLKRNASLFNVPLLDTPQNFFSEVAKQVVGIQRILVERQLANASSAEVERIAGLCMEAIHKDASLRNEEDELKLSPNMFMNILLACGMSEAAAQECIQNTSTPQVKAQLNKNTQEAVDAGAFGSPTMLVTPPTGGDAFFVFGSDRFEQIAHVCGLPYLGADPSRARI